MKNKTLHWLMSSLGSNWMTVSGTKTGDSGSRVTTSKAFGRCKSTSAISVPRSSLNNNEKSLKTNPKSIQVVVENQNCVLTCVLCFSTFMRDIFFASVISRLLNRPSFGASSSGWWTTRFSGPPFRHIRAIFCILLTFWGTVVGLHDRIGLDLFCIRSVRWWFLYGFDACSERR